MASTQSSEMLNKWTDRELKVIEGIIAENSGDEAHRLAVIRSRFDEVAERRAAEEADGIYIVSHGGILRYGTVSCATE